MINTQKERHLSIVGSVDGKWLRVSNSERNSDQELSKLKGINARDILIDTLLDKIYPHIHNLSESAYDLAVNDTMNISTHPRF